MTPAAPIILIVGVALGILVGYYVGDDTTTVVALRPDECPAGTTVRGPITPPRPVQIGGATYDVVWQCLK